MSTFLLLPPVDFLIEELVLSKTFCLDLFGDTDLDTGDADLDELGEQLDEETELSAWEATLFIESMSDRDDENDGSDFM